ncbi:MAG: hypothetical protein V9H69_04990 [Anaerolineae bacterium]
MKFRPTQTFWEAYAALPGEVKEQAREAFRRFQEGAESPPFHPSLRIRRMQGHSGIWEGHVTLKYVFTFHIEQNSATGETIYVFRTIGSHDIYRRP